MTKYSLASIDPTLIVGANELWVFNVKTRKLGKYIASNVDPKGLARDGTGLSVKGTTIIGFDETTSIQKTLRKPEDQLKEFKTSGKVALRTFLDDIKTTDTMLNGRCNPDTILLKVSLINTYMSNELETVLASLGQAINQKIISAPAPALDIHDRSISGNKLNGGTYANFASTGIKDKATYAGAPILTIENDKIVTDAIAVNTVLNPLTIKGNLTVEGGITAHTLHVNEITSDTRTERSTPLEFKGENNQAPYNKGLIWTGVGPTRQFMFREGDDRFFSSEAIDLQNGKNYKINNTTVLAETELGTTVVSSNLRRVGTLQTLKVAGNVTIGEYLFWDNDV